MKPARPILVAVVMMLAAVHATTTPGCQANALEAQADTKLEQAQAEIEKRDDLIAERDAVIQDLEQAIDAEDFDRAATLRDEANALQARVEDSDKRQIELQQAADALLERAKAEDESFAGFTDVGKAVGELIPGGAVATGIGGALVAWLRKKWRKQDAEPFVEIIDKLRDEYDQVDDAFKSDFGSKARAIIATHDRKLQKAVKDLKKSRS